MSLRTGIVLTAVVFSAFATNGLAAALQPKAALAVLPRIGNGGSIATDAGSSVPRDHGPVSRTIVSLATTEAPGTIIISNGERFLYRVLGNGQAERYTISIGREGFIWTGTVYVGAKQEWPGWRPPADMLARQPSLPEYVPPGPLNPLGARALYLFQNGHDTLYRIHGTSDPNSLGSSQTSGCFRLSNADVMILYELVTTGTKVIVK